MKILLGLAALLLLTTTGEAKKKEPEAKSFKGYLMDKMCAKRRAGDVEKMKNHTKTCLTEEACAKSGYGVLVKGKFIPFDQKGNELAAAYIKNHTGENDFEIDALGNMKKGKLALVGINNPPVKLN
ncbi:MAG: hypothetical protein WCH46_05040 [bacterium]